MISIVLYGRNDSYGYNLHKRAALSLNCMAEVLTEPEDEILFVDYNTPDDFPTFPEAIQDTLTEKAKARLRILRVRPSVHERFKGRTHLQALEPVARNVAIRRSNPANRWILSTNTDMIFVPRNGQSLSEIVRDLPKGYYGIPRFEIPESLWESLDRYDAPGTIRDVGDWGWKFHLNEIVYGAPTIKFDAPGDFQLIDRDDLHRIHGFNEEMLLGWHVDSNICKRLFTVYGEVGDLSDKLFGYHCDHTRQVTPMHRRTAVENSMARFVDGVSEAEVPAQAESWGCPDAEIECLTIASGASQSYLGALQDAMPAAMTVPSEVAYIRESYDEIDYDPAHVLPYLMDVLSSVPRDWSIAWFGLHVRMFRMFRAAWSGMGFRGRIHVASGLVPDGENAGADLAVHAAAKDAVSAADTFVLDFSTVTGGALGGDPSGVSKALIVGLTSTLGMIVAEELARQKTARLMPRRIIAINAIHNRFEPLMRGYVEFARSPFSARLRHGYVASFESGRSIPWLGQMTLKGVGAREGATVVVPSGARGQVVTGPYLSILPGRYAVLVEIAPRLAAVADWPRLLLGLFRSLDAVIPGRVPPAPRPIQTAPGPALKPPRWKKRGAVAIEIRDGSRILSRHGISLLRLLTRRVHRFALTVDAESLAEEIPTAIALRLWSGGWVPFSIIRIAVEAESR